MPGDYYPSDEERREHERQQEIVRIRRIYAELDKELQKIRDDGPWPDDE